MNTSIDKSVKHRRVITIAIAIYLFFAPLDFIPVVQGISISKILMVIPIVISIFYLNKMKIRIEQLSIIIFMYLLYLSANILYSTKPVLSIDRTSTLFLNLGIILFLSSIRFSEFDIKTLKNAAALSSWFVVILITIFSSGSYLINRTTVIINGVYQDPNYLSGFLLFGAVYYLKEYFDTKKIINLLSVVLMIITVIRTGSRGGLIALAGALIIYTITWMFRERVYSRFIKIVIAVLVAGIITGTIIINYIPSSVLNRYSIDFTIEDQGAERFTIWNNIIIVYNSASITNKIFGFGSGTIREQNIYHKVAHNTWLESLIEIGVLGTIILSLIYILFMRRALRLKEDVLLAVLVGYFILGLSISAYSYKPIWNILLMILVVNNSQLSQKNTNNNTIV